LSKSAERNLLKKEFFCNNCGDLLEFYDSTDKRHNLRYCSSECWLNSRKVDFACQFCGRVIRLAKCLTINKKFCSRECYGKVRKGKKLSEEHRRKIGEANKNPSAETRRKMSKRMIKDWQNPERRKKLIESLNIRPTRIVSKIIDVIHSNKLPFKYVGDGKFVIITKKRTYIPDFVHVSKKQVIECNGDYWHNYEKDNAKTKGYRSIGWRVLNLTGSEINELDNRNLAKIISAFESGKNRLLRKENYK